MGLKCIPRLNVYPPHNRTHALPPMVNYICSACTWANTYRSRRTTSNSCLSCSIWTRPRVLRALPMWPPVCCSMQPHRQLCSGGPTQDPAFRRLTSPWVKNWTLNCCHIAEGMAARFSSTHWLTGGTSNVGTGEVLINASRWRSAHLRFTSVVHLHTFC